MTRNKIKTVPHQKFVEWSEEDHCFIGRCPTLFEGGVHGSDKAKVFAELCLAVEECFEIEEREDRADGKAARKALAEGEKKGFIPWEEVKAGMAKKTKRNL